MMPSPYLWSGIPAALYYAYYRNYCGQVPEIFAGEGAFLELLREKCPALKEEYRPPPLVHESRLMTIVAALGRHRGLTFPYMREVFETSDGGDIALDWWDARLKPQSAAEVPVIASSSLAESLSYYYNALPPFRFPHFQVPYFGQVKRSASGTGSELTQLTKKLDPISNNNGPEVILTEVPVESVDGFIIPSSVSSLNLAGELDLTVPTEALGGEDIPVLGGNSFSVPLSGLEIRSLELKGVVLVLPGLTGDSTQNYVQGLVQVVESLGYTAVVMNYRGTTGNLKTPKSYCAADTSDVAEVVQRIKLRYPKVPIIGVGVSLGGILLTNYVARCGRENVDSLLAGVMVVSVAWNFFESCKVLEQPLNWLLFNRMLTRALCDVVHRHANILQPSFDLKSLKNVKTLREFDECFTAKMFGYTGSDDYYKRASLHDKVQYIKTPLLAINAADDMFSPYEAIPKEDAKKNPNLCIVVTSHGGHIGFMEQRNPLGRNYVERVFEQFAKAIFERANQRDESVMLVKVPPETRADVVPLVAAEC